MEHTKDHRKDPWLRVFCPEDACLSEEEKVSPSQSRVTDTDKHSTWLDTFCPEDSCQADTPTSVV